MPGAYGGKQLLHLVFGVYPNHGVCESKARGSIDNAFTRHFVVHPCRLIQPEAKGSGSK